MFGSTDLGFCEKYHAHLRSEETSEVRAARLEGMIATDCADYNVW